MEKEIILGKILDVTKYQVVIQCVINEEDKVLETRKFSKDPFEGVVRLEEGNFVEIHITTEPGKRIFEYKNCERDLSHLFVKKDYFADFESPILESLKNSPFFNSKDKFTNGQDI